MDDCNVIQFTTGGGGGYRCWFWDSVSNVDESDCNPDTTNSWCLYTKANGPGTQLTDYEYNFTTILASKCLKNKYFRIVSTFLEKFGDLDFNNALLFLLFLVKRKVEAANFTSFKIN